MYTVKPTMVSGPFGRDLQILSHLSCKTSLRKLNGFNRFMGSEFVLSLANHLCNGGFFANVYARSELVRKRKRGRKRCAVKLLSITSLCNLHINYSMGLLSVYGLRYLVFFLLKTVLNK